MVVVGVEAVAGAVAEDLAGAVAGVKEHIHMAELTTECLT